MYVFGLTTFGLGLCLERFVFLGELVVGCLALLWLLIGVG